MNELDYLKKYIHPGEDLEEAIKRLESGEPVQYIVGDVNFYGNIIKVNKNVLIPRRETEELVEKTIEYINKIFPNQSIDILDIGTGSGCIPISLKKELKKISIDAVDISKEALEIAKENAINNNVSINYIYSDIFSNVNKKYNCIISNPPYLKENDYIMDIVKNNEPNIALFAKDNGLYFYKKILKDAKKYLKDKYLIAFEIGDTQKEDIINIAKTYFKESTIEASKDLQKLDRFIFIHN